jgi:carboxypeptidase PM20D1
MPVDLILSVLIVLFVLLLFVAAVLIFRATLYGRVPEVVEAADPAPVDAAQVAEHLGAAIRQQTVSEGDRSRIVTKNFDSLHAALERLYPLSHAALKRERVNDWSLLYTWPGRAPELEPALLCGHLDVVPVDPSTESEWTHGPFSGEVADGFVWGRGALDIKSTVIGLLEAVEALLKTGYQPERTLYLAFGHDEEIGGWMGARCIVDLLMERGVRLSAVLDEGGCVMEGMVPGVAVPVAMVGVAEKGHVSLELRVEGRPGHSAMPPRHTAIGVLARALARVEANPMPTRLSMTRLMYEELGAFLPFTMRLALANPGLFSGAIRKRMSANPTGSAFIRTTAAPTVIQGGVKDNILPAQARAVVNCRILPGDKVHHVVDHYRKVIDDEAVQISYKDEAAWEPSPVSPVDSPIYQNLTRTIRQIFPEAIASPYLVVGATDARYYTRICSSVYRFSPYGLTPELLKSVHGIDERIPVDMLERMVQFYAQLIKSWTTAVGTAE